jgi:hypothetical protein
LAVSYRTIKLYYEFSEYTLYIQNENETIGHADIETIKATLSGKNYKQVTGTSYEWKYTFEFASQEVFDFFNNAYLAETDGNQVQFSRENYQNVYSAYQDCIISRPTYQEVDIDTAGVTIYSNLEVTIRNA